MMFISSLCTGVDGRAAAVADGPHPAQGRRHRGEETVAAGVRFHQRVRLFLGRARPSRTAVWSHV